jgi:hypothetical protein
MPVSRAEVTVELVNKNIVTCPVCFQTGPLVRLYVECQEQSGNSVAMCPTCLMKGTTTRVTLESPPQTSGARPPGKRIRKAARRQERAVAEDLHGRTQKASGACIGSKGDVRVPDVLRGEMKCTTKKSFIVKRDVLDKIRSECVGREKPFVHIQFIHPITLTPQDEWVCIPYEHWEYVNAARNNS